MINGARLTRTLDTDVSLYIGDDLERDPSGVWTKYLYDDVRMVGGDSQTPGDLSFLHRDHLASVSAVTDDTGALDRSFAFQPYGSEAQTVADGSSPAVSKTFTGERFDAEAGLIYLHARYGACPRA